jgi:hypothetical protein
MTVEEERLAVVGHAKISVLQVGYLALLNESRIKNADELHAPAGKASGFPEETQVGYF